VRIVLLGPPGAGKGSLATLCEERLGLPHLSAGEMFRQEIAHGTMLGRRVKRYVASGSLVPDALVLDVMAKRLRTSRGARRFVLDGFPRTEGQAEGLDRVLVRWRTPLDGAVSLKVPEHILVKRLSGRLVCERCGANYHVRTMKPARAGVCDRCPGRLVTRKDDQPDTIRRRLVVDRQASSLLVRYYRQQGLLYEIDGRGRISGVFARAWRLFERKGWLRNPG
jgi:adenylate kinase